MISYEKFLRLIGLVSVLVLMIGSVPGVGAYSSYPARLPNGTVFSCDTCHINGYNLNSFGSHFNNAGRSWSYNLSQQDSDNDGYLNGVELLDPNGVWSEGDPDPGSSSDVTNPGDSNSHPVPPTATPSPTATLAPPTLTPTPTPIPPTQTPTAIACINDGDPTLDGSITAGDAQLCFQIALGAYSPSYEEECAADCSADGAVTAGDAQAVFAAALGSGECVDPIE